MKNIYIKPRIDNWIEGGYVVDNSKEDIYINKKGDIKPLEFRKYKHNLNTIWKKELMKISAAEAQKLVPSVDAKTLKPIKLIKKIIVAKNPVKVLFPKPSVYQMTYQKVSGEQDAYEISSPIAVTEEQIVAYCFNRKGLRTFKRSGILEISEK